MPILALDSRVRGRVLVALGAGIAALVIIGGCSSDEGATDTGGPAAGTKGGPCLPSRGCDIGLICRDKKCVESGGTGAWSSTTP